MRYEYKLLTAKLTDAEAAVNELSAQGWELIESHQMIYRVDDDLVALLWFKRLTGDGSDVGEWLVRAMRGGQGA